MKQTTIRNTLLAMALIGQTAMAQTWSGSTSPAATWNRPQENDLAKPTVLSSVGTATPLESKSFTVANSGNYSLVSTASGWDNTLFLYDGGFSSTAPLTNIRLGSDDLNFGTNIAGWESVNLKSGITYTWVVTGFANFDFGQYSTVLGVSTVGDPIAGTIDLEHWTAETTGQALNVEILQPGTETAVANFTVPLDSSGGYTFKNVLTGTYDVRFKVSHWLKKRIAGVVIASGTTTVNATLRNGDIDNDNVVSVFDYVLLSDDFDSAAARSDLDGDGIVSVFDYIVLSDGFDQEGD